jgi:hypothetical protein
MESKTQEIVNVGEVFPIFNMTDCPNPAPTNDGIPTPRNIVLHPQQQLCYGVDGGGKPSESCFTRSNLACPFHKHNAEKYQANNVTGHKYRLCAGPGWGSFQRLK